MPNQIRYKSSHWLQFLILGGIVLLVLLVLAFKDQSQPDAPAGNGKLPEVQLERALSAGKPALAFFHSNNCEQCLTMIKTVEQVYPEFSSSVYLIDVNVYDPNNEPLLQKVKLKYIPMLVFYGQSGQSQTYVGVMEANALRQLLMLLGGIQ